MDNMYYQKNDAIGLSMLKQVSIFMPILRKQPFFFSSYTPNRSHTCVLKVAQQLFIGYIKKENTCIMHLES